MFSSAFLNWGLVEQYWKTLYFRMDSVSVGNAVNVVLFTNNKFLEIVNAFLTKKTKHCGQLYVFAFRQQISAFMKPRANYT